MKATTTILAITAAVTCSAQNMIGNPTFQQADKAGKAIYWGYQTSQFTRVQSDKPGRFAMKSVKIVRPADKKSVSMSIYQFINIPKPGKYVISFDSKAVEQGVINASWNFLDKNSKMIRIKGPCWTAVNTSTTWKKITHVLDIPEGVAKIQLNITGRIDQAFKHTAGAVMIDEVSFAPQK